MLKNELKIKLLKDMMAIRKFEKVIKDLYKEGLVEGAIHCYTGEEAVAVGVCAVLRDDDFIAELMGKSAGLSNGMGGSMHLFDTSQGLMGGNGIVGGGIPISLGTAYSSKYRGTDQVTVCFFSEGASNQGTFHESLNMASLWKLPLIFVCENNLFAATTPSYKTLSHPDVAIRAGAYSMEGIICDGNDVLDVLEKTAKAVDKARDGQGPALIECKTYRVEGHCMVLKDLAQHRPKDEVEGWAQRDPIDLFEKKLLAEGIIDEEKRSGIEAQLDVEFNEAIEFSKKSGKPDVSNFLSIARERYGLDI